MPSTNCLVVPLPISVGVLFPLPWALSRPCGALGVAFKKLGFEPPGHPSRDNPNASVNLKCNPGDTCSLRRLTGVKRSAFGRLSGRQRPEADEVEGGEEQQRPGNGAPALGQSHDKPPTGDPAGSCSIPFACTPQAKGARPAYETFPAGTSSPAGRYLQRPTSTSDTHSPNQISESKVGGPGAVGPRLAGALGRAGGRSDGEPQPAIADPQQVGQSKH